MSTAAVLAAAGVLLLSSTGLAWLDPATDTSVIIVRNTADTQLSFYAGPAQQTEWQITNGSRADLRIKGHQDLSLLKFNLAAYKGKTVEEAELHLSRANTNQVFALVASTVNTDWSETYACYRYRNYQTDWTFHNSDVGTAAFGNYGSLVCYGYAQDDTFKTYTVGTQNWIAMKLGPDLVHAMILDQPGGLVVTDPRCHLYGNPTIRSKETGTNFQPRLYIKFAATTDTTPPGAVTGLTATAGPRAGQAVLSFDAPADPEAAKAFGYNVRYSTTNNFATATPVDRWRIARPKSPGMPQKVLLEGLTAGNTYYFFVQAYDAAGNGSTVASTSLLMPSINLPTIPDGEFTAPDPAGKTVRTIPGVLKYWAAHETTKVHPVTGNRIEQNYTSTTPYEDYKKANVVWDAAANTISLRACRNEVVGAQLIIERIAASLTNVKVTVSDLVSAGGGMIASNPYVELFQVDYVTSGTAQYPEAAIPLSAPFATTFSIPDANRNPSGTNQTVWMDLYVPKDAAVGNYAGAVTITAAELASPVTIHLKVRVSPVTIPDYPTFMIDLNGYGNPWDFGSNFTMTCLRYFQVCHKHRAVPNTVPYSWNGNILADRAPGIAGGQPNIFVASWTNFDNKYGRLFDGTAFLPTTPGSPYYGPGTGTPITHFYTCFNDSWPMQIRNDYYGFDPKYGPERITGMPMKGGLYWTNLIDTNSTTFFATAPDTFAAFADSFRRVNREFIASWIQHAAAKGWTKTAFECYLNNKYSYSGANSLWTLEECETADDFRAVGFYHQLYRDGQAQANQPQIPWHFRVDISDRWGQNYGEFDNRINWQVVGSGAANWHWPNREYRKYHLDHDKQETWLSYSDGTGITSSNIYNTRAMLQRWCQGFDGSVVYWDNFGASWDTADNLCMVYDGQNVPGHGAYDGAIVSIRLKALRQVQQLIEMLNLWGNNVEGLNRLLVRDAFVMKYGASAWGYSFSTLDEVKLYRMRSDLTQALEEALFLPGDIDGDSMVNVFDIFRIAEAWNTSQGDPMYDEFCDLDKDGAVNVFDVFVIAEYWNQSKPLPEW